MADETKILCVSANKDCLIKELETLIPSIENQKWKDETYRDYAKILTLENKIDEAIKLIEIIENPDTKAMTIRGIGMNAAKLELDKDNYKALFSKLHEQANLIKHEPSFEIALTYIAMAQAEAKLDHDAIATALSMKNIPLQHKALGEIAETQSMRKDHEKALNTLDKISSNTYKNKACRTVSRIMVNGKAYDQALKAARKIDNAYMKSEALLYILEEIKNKKNT